MALTTHGQWIMGSTPIRVISGARKGIWPQLLLYSNDNLVPRPTQKNSHFMVSLGGEDKSLKMDVSLFESLDKLSYPVLLVVLLYKLPVLALVALSGVWV